jgi:hypothetical protein
VWNAESEIKTAGGLNYSYDGDGDLVEKRAILASRAWIAEAGRAEAVMGRLAGGAGSFPAMPFGDAAALAAFDDPER